MDILQLINKGKQNMKILRTFLQSHGIRFNEDCKRDYYIQRIDLNGGRKLSVAFVPDPHLENMFETMIIDKDAKLDHDSMNRFSIDNIEEFVKYYKSLE